MIEIASVMSESLKHYSDTKCGIPMIYFNEKLPKNHIEIYKQEYPDRNLINDFNNDNKNIPDYYDDIVTDKDNYIFVVLLYYYSDNNSYYKSGLEIRELKPISNITNHIHPITGHLSVGRILNFFSFRNLPNQNYSILSARLIKKTESNLCPEYNIKIPQFPHYENRVLYNKPYINKNEWYYKQTPTDDYIGKKYKKYINNIIPSIKIMIKKEIKKIKEIKNNYELTCNDPDKIKEYVDQINCTYIKSIKKIAHAKLEKINYSTACKYELKDDINNVIKEIENLQQL